MRIQSWGDIKIAFSLNSIELPTVYAIVHFDEYSPMCLSFCYDGRDVHLCSDILSDNDRLLLLDDSASLSLLDIENSVAGMRELKAACLAAIDENRALAHDEQWVDYIDQMDAVACA